MVKNPFAMQETQVPSLGGEDLLEKRMATHSNILALRTLWTEGSGELQSMAGGRGVTKSGTQLKGCVTFLEKGKHRQSASLRAQNYTNPVSL